MSYLTCGSREVHVSRASVCHVCVSAGRCFSVSDVLACQGCPLIASVSLCARRASVSGVSIY